MHIFGRDIGGGKTTALFVLLMIYLHFAKDDPNYQLFPVKTATLSWRIGDLAHRFFPNEALEVAKRATSSSTSTSSSSSSSSSSGDSSSSSSSSPNDVDIWDGTLWADLRVVGSDLYNKAWEYIGPSSSTSSSKSASSRSGSSSKSYALTTSASSPPQALDRILRDTLPNFLHVDAAHLFLNCISLWIVGGALETGSHGVGSFFFFFLIILLAFGVPAVVGLLAHMFADQGEFALPLPDPLSYYIRQAVPFFNPFFLLAWFTKVLTGAIGGDSGADGSSGTGSGSNSNNNGNASENPEDFVFAPGSWYTETARGFSGIVFALLAISSARQVKFALRGARSKCRALFVTVPVAIPLFGIMTITLPMWWPVGLFLPTIISYIMAHMVMATTMNVKLSLCVHLAGTIAGTMIVIMPDIFSSFLRFVWGGLLGVLGCSSSSSSRDTHASPALKPTTATATQPRTAAAAAAPVASKTAASSIPTPTSTTAATTNANKYVRAGSPGPQRIGAGGGVPTSSTSTSTSSFGSGHNNNNSAHHNTNYASASTHFPGTGASHGSSTGSPNSPFAYASRNSYGISTSSSAGSPSSWINGNDAGWVNAERVAAFIQEAGLLAPDPQPHQQQPQRRPSVQQQSGSSMRPPTPTHQNFVNTHNDDDDDDDKDSVIAEYEEFQRKQQADRLRAQQQQQQQRQQQQQQQQQRQQQGGGGGAPSTTGGGYGGYAGFAPRPRAGSVGR